MTQLKKVVDPFGEVNVHPGPRSSRIVATILMKPSREGTQTGIALDGSGSMRKMYGMEDAGRVLSPIFGAPKKASNEITPVAQKLCAYLARNIDADGGTTCIYWAVGPGGSQIQAVGDFKAEQAERHTFGPPADLGTGTQLLPAVKYFVERFKDAPWGFYVFITDGELHDLDEVIGYSKRLAQDIKARRRNPVKFVLIGLGPDVNEYQMTELDDMDTGTDIDLWDHKLASEMRVLEEIFAEVVEKNARVANSGRILDHQGRVVKDYSDTGLPAYLEFEVPVGCPHFVLEVNGQRIQQSLVDGASVPGVISPPSERAPMPQKDTPAMPAKTDEMIEELPIDDPAAKEWRDLPLEFAKEEPAKPGVDVDLEQHKD